MKKKVMWIKKIIKTGDSFGVVLPWEARDALGIKRGDYLVLRLTDRDQIVIEKLTAKNYPNAFQLRGSTVYE